MDIKCIANCEGFTVGKIYSLINNDSAYNDKGQLVVIPCRELKIRFVKAIVCPHCGDDMNNLYHNVAFCSRFI